MEDGACATFSEIDIRAAHFAGGLAELGVRRGDRVLLHLPNSIEWIVAYHAAARLGAVIVPANILLTAGEVAYIGEHSGATAVLCAADRHCAIADTFPTPASLPIFITLGEPTAGFAYQSVARSPALDPCETSPADLFTIGYTSGTTGRPKGAMTSHRAVLGSTATTATIHVRHSRDRVLSALPFSHVYGNVVMNAAFVAGYELVAMPRFDAARTLEIIEAQRITLFEGVPTMYYQMLQQPLIEQGDFSSLDRCTVGGQTMPDSTMAEVEKRLGCPLLELWGMTELAGPATSHSPYWPSRHGSIGRPFPGTGLRIVDLVDATLRAPAGSIGELQAKGDLVSMGYWQDAAATDAAFDASGWFSTGDIATEDGEGYFHIVDRRKDMIITAGYNIYPAELERAIALHPAVAMVAVGPVPDPEKGELAKAYIVLRPAATSTIDDILAHCRRHLAAYKVPRVVAFVDDLPKTSTGKIMRRALADSHCGADNRGKDPT
jgi:long-chain acyl-CoA synthetase